MPTKMPITVVILTTISANNKVTLLPLKTLDKIEKKVSSKIKQNKKSIDKVNL